MNPVRAHAVTLIACWTIAQPCSAVARAGDLLIVLRSRDSPQYNEAVRGFMEEWQSHNTALSIQQRTLEGNDATNLQFSADQQPAVVVAVGTEATRWAIKNTSGPVVFCMVANAQQNVLAGLSTAEAARVSGVALDIPVKIQLSQLKTFLPRAKRIGVLYDPRKSGAAVKEAAQAAGELGLELVTQEVAAESSLPEAADLIVSRIDVLWAPVDSTVYNSRSAQFVLTEMLKRRVPVMGFSENMVKAGALLALRVSYAAVGKQTASLLQAVLAGARFENGAVQPPQTFDIVVNARVLRLVDKSIPASSIQKVSMIDE